MIGKLLVVISYILSISYGQKVSCSSSEPSRCYIQKIPENRQECRSAAKQNGKNKGCVTKNHATEGCYSYSKGKYKSCVFWGTDNSQSHFNELHAYGGVKQIWYVVNAEDGKQYIQHNYGDGSYEVFEMDTDQKVAYGKWSIRNGSYYQNSSYGATGTGQLYGDAKNFSIDLVDKGNNQKMAEYKGYYKFTGVKNYVKGRIQKPKSSPNLVILKLTYEVKGPKTFMKAIKLAEQVPVGHSKLQTKNTQHTNSDSEVESQEPQDKLVFVMIIVALVIGSIILILLVYVIFKLKRKQVTEKQETQNQSQANSEFNTSNEQFKNLGSQLASRGHGMPVMMNLVDEHSGMPVEMAYPVEPGTEKHNQQ